MIDQTKHKGVSLDRCTLKFKMMFLIHGVPLFKVDSGTKAPSISGSINFSTWVSRSLMSLFMGELHRMGTDWRVLGERFSSGGERSVFAHACWSQSHFTSPKAGKCNFA